MLQFHGLLFWVQEIFVCHYTLAVPNPGDQIPQMTPILLELFPLLRTGTIYTPAIYFTRTHFTNVGAGLPVSQWSFGILHTILWQRDSCYHSFHDIHCCHSDPRNREHCPQLVNPSQNTVQLCTDSMWFKHWIVFTFVFTYRSNS